MDYRPSFHESVRPAELPVPVHSEQNPRSIAPSLRELTELGRSRVWSSQFGAWPPACAKAGGWSRLHCLGRRRLTSNGVHPLAPTDAPENPVSPRQAIADHRGTRLGHVPA